MSLTSWLVFVAVAILPAISPGPAILNAVSNAIRFGPRSVVYSGFGNALGLTCLGFAVAFGFAAAMEASAYAFTAVKLIGAAYLLYLGAKLWFGNAALTVDAEQAPVQKSNRALFAQAFLLSITNPKAVFLLAVILPPFIDPASNMFTQVTILSLTYATMCFCNHMFLALMGARARRFLSSPKRVKAVQRALGGLFMAFGASLAFASR